MYPPKAPEAPRHGGRQQTAAPQHRGTPHSNPQAPVLNSVSAFVTHAKALESLDRTRYPEEFEMLSDRIRELEPLLRVHGILDVMQVKNPEVAALIGA
ncbi:hypothetical protein [Nocardia stercoris]|uniref:Uncharacterized protein n=1 Tax=Nocardia stercoris TaxID=2483361 RepID=A0A3M2KX38_9NOCA|nr:hypothetical protein [Nocardia stercoris]RMI29821.1 hypothetical protein EBN03_23745 [Nocardia stercoris]